MAEDMENIAELLRKEKVVRYPLNMVLMKHYFKTFFECRHQSVKVWKFNLVPTVFLSNMLDHKAQSAPRYTKSKN